MNIPVIFVDEHHEAFVAWHLFREKGIIPAMGNYLLHIDHHDDMECGGYDWDFSLRIETAAEARQCLDRALGIADFIIPAVYYGFFSTVHILKNIQPMDVCPKEKVVFRRSESELKCWDYVPFLHAPKKKDPSSGYHFFTWINGGLEEHPAPLGKIVLDVDLDYFCWDDSLSSVPEKRLEITAEAYEEYWADKNHPFRILPRRLLHVKADAGKYYLVYREHFLPPGLADEETIVRRIERLLAYLAASGAVPMAIDICRSSFSGYLPHDRAAFVEREFLSRLSEVMELEFLQL